MFGADGRSRTDGLRFTKALLYQLSYIGTRPHHSSKNGCFWQRETRNVSLYPETLYLKHSLTVRTVELIGVDVIE